MSTVKGPLNSATAPDSTLVGGVHNVQPPAPLDGQQCALQMDANGNLLVNVAVGGGGASSNVNITGINGVPPALTNPLPVELSDGTQALGTVGNPINVTGSISATNPSVGIDGAVAPTSATEIGSIDAFGKLQGASAGNPIPTTVLGDASAVGTLSNNNAPPGPDLLGTMPAVASAANPAWSEGSLVLESVDLTGNQRVKINAALPAGANVIGHVIADTGSTTVVTGNVTVVQPTGTNLHVVVDSGSTTSASGTLTNNNAAPGANNMGVLPGLANAVAPTWTEGDQVLESVDLKGNQRVILNAETAKVIGTVNQGTSPWVTTDTAAAASLVTIASDVGILPTALTFIQAVASSAGTAISTLDKVFGSNVTKNNVLLLMAMESAAAIPTWAKSAGTATVQSLGVIKSSATAPGFSLQAWLVTVSGTLTMTATSGGGASVDMAAYATEIQGVFPAGVATTSIPWWDAIQVSQGTAASFAFTPFYTETIGELPFLFIGVGSAATISALSLGDAILVNSQSNATTGGSGNLQLFSADRPTNAAPYLKMGQLSPTITFSGSTLYTAVYISLRPYQLSIAGSVTSNLNRVGGALVTTTATASGTQVVGLVGGTGTTLETTAGVLDENLKNIANSTVATAASGVQKVGIVGGTGVILDAVITAATAPANALAVLSVNQTTAPSLTVGQSVALQSDYVGSIFVKPCRRSETLSQATTINATGVTTILASGGTGIFTDISNLIITVTPAAGAVADVALTATLSDGTKSYIFDLDTGATGTATVAGGPPTGVNTLFNPPLPASSTATAWTLNLSAGSVTVHVTVVAVLQKAS